MDRKFSECSDYFMAISKMPVGSRKENLVLKIKQIVAGAVATIVIDSVLHGLRMGW